MCLSPYTLGKLSYVVKHGEFWDNRVFSIHHFYLITGPKKALKTLDYLTIKNTFKPYECRHTVGRAIKTRPNLKLAGKLI